MEGRRFTVVPKETIDTWVEAIGVNKIPEEVTEVLCEDVTYHIRELVHKAMQFMKHSRRSYLSVADINSALKESDTDPIFGQNGIETLNFKSVPYKEGSKVCYLDEKDVNLRELALDSVYPQEAVKTSVKANWLVLEGHACGTNHLKESHGPLNETTLSYLQNITNALIGNGEQLRKVALEDIRINKKLQIVVPHLVSFCSSQIKQHTGKKYFAAISHHVTSIIGAMVKNPSVILTPYLIQLAKIMLFILIEAKLDVKDWYIKDHAAYVLSSISRRHLNSSPDVHEQLLKSYLDTLKDAEKPFSQIYGGLSGIKHLGLKAICTGLYPSLSEKLKNLQKRMTPMNNPQNAEILMVFDLLNKTISILYQSRFHAQTKPYIRKNSPKLSELYSEVAETIGEAFVLRCTQPSITDTEPQNHNAQTLLSQNTAKQTSSGPNTENTDTTSKIPATTDENDVEIKPKLVKDVDSIATKTSSSLGEISFTSKQRKRKEVKRTNVFCDINNEMDIDEFTEEKKNRPIRSSLRKTLRGSHRSMVKHSTRRKRNWRSNIYLPIL